MKPKNELIRLVKNSDNMVTIDRSGKMPGRGAYVCGNMDCYNKMIKNKIIQKIFRMSVNNEFYTELKKQIESESNDCNNGNVKNKDNKKLIKNNNEG
jgi:uncharacterized protein